MIIFSSCNITKIPEAKKDNLPEWTIFIYGHADHSLTPNMMGDIAEMVSATIDPSVKVILAVDADSNNEHLPVGHPWKTPGTYIYEILGTGKGEAKLIETRPEENMDDPETLTSHVVNAFTKYPSKKKGVILWDHGGSWDGGFGGDYQNHLDDPAYHQGGMTIHKVKSALSASATTLKLGSTPFDFIAFDTCLMGNIETAYEFKNLAYYYFASAEIDYGAGWDYENSLSLFSSNPKALISQLAPYIVSQWDEQHANSGQVMDELLRTQIALDLSKLDSFALQFQSFVSSSLNNSLNKAALSLNRSGPGYHYGDLSSLNDSPQSRDIGQFFSLLAADPELNADATSLQNNLINNVIKATSLGDNRDGFQLGLSIESRHGSTWLEGGDDSTRGRYQALLWNSRTVWSSFLDGISLMAYFDTAGPTFTPISENMVGPDASHQPTISFETTDTDVNDGVINILENQGGLLISWGVVGHGFLEANQEKSYSWDGKISTLTNGSVVSDVMVGIYGSPGLDGEGNTVALGIKIPGVLTNGVISYDVELVGYESPLSTFILHLETDKFEVKEYSDFADLGGWSFRPKIATSLGYIYSTTLSIVDTVEGFDLGQKSAPAGHYALQSIMKDVWGNPTSNLSPVTVVTPF